MHHQDLCEIKLTVVFGIQCVLSKKVNARFKRLFRVSFTQMNSSTLILSEISITAYLLMLVDNHGSVSCGRCSKNVWWCGLLLNVLIFEYILKEKLEKM